MCSISLVFIFVRICLPMHWMSLFCRNFCIALMLTLYSDKVICSDSILLTPRQVCLFESVNSGWRRTWPSLFDMEQLGVVSLPLPVPQPPQGSLPHVYLAHTLLAFWTRCMMGLRHYCCAIGSFSLKKNIYLRYYVRTLDPYNTFNTKLS